MAIPLLPELPEYLPVFPLPNLVLFPRCVQFLHIFEPRYQAMMRDVLSREPDQRLFALALLRPGYEAKYYTNHAAVYPVAGLALVIRHEQTPDGRYNLIVRGLCRARIEEEDRTGMYRRARLVPLGDHVESGREEHRQALLSRMRQAIHHPVVERSPHGPQVQQWFESDLSLGELSDLVAFYLLPNSTIEVKQVLMEALDVEARAEVLLRELESLIRRRAPLAGPAEWPLESGLN